MGRGPDLARSATPTKGFALEDTGIFQSSNSAWADFNARTLLVGSAPLRGEPAGTSLSWRFSGKAEKGGYDRRFETAIGEVQIVDIAPYAQWEVELLRIPKVQGLRAWVAVSAGVFAGSRPSRQTLATAYAAAGTFPVPPGAQRVYTATTIGAGGFAWDAITADGVALSIAEILTIGQGTEVKGTHFTISAAANLVWEVWL